MQFYLLLCLFGLFSCKERYASRLSNSDESSDELRFHGMTLVRRDQHFVAKDDKKSNPTTLGLTTASSYKDRNLEYKRRCEQLSVPSPPRWGTPGWVKRGDIDSKKMAVQFIPKNSDAVADNSAELWTYLASADAMCVSNPRMSKTPAIYTIAVICHNKRTGGTCFWDSNLEGHPAKQGYDFIADGFSGDVSTEDCTSCHRGSSPWIRIPKDVTLNTIGRAWSSNRNWKPLGSSEWELSSATQIGPHVEGCSNCHAMPKPTANYCKIIKRYFALKVMPPGDNWARNSDVLKRYCNVVSGL